MGTPKFSRQTPWPVSQWLSKVDLAFPIANDLYKASEDSDRKIRAGRVSRNAALAQLTDWAVAKLAANKDFTAAHWENLAEVTRVAQSNGWADFRIFFGDVLVPSVGGNVAWRASKSEQAKIVERVDAIAKELIELIDTSVNMDVDLRDLANADAKFESIAEESRKLTWQASNRWTEEARKRARETDLTTGGRLTATMHATEGNYQHPRLTDFLCAMRMRIAGTLPNITIVGEALRSLTLVERAAITSVFDTGHEIEDVSAPPSKLVIGGEFGAYPSRKLALRSATLHAAASKIFLPSGAPPSFPVAGFLQAICLAWFDDAPERKEIDTLIRPYRAQQKKISEEAASWDDAMNGAFAENGDPIDEKP